MLNRLLFLSIFLLVLSSCTDTKPDNIKIACIGDSITFGSGIQDREQNCYPAQLQNILGPEYTVKNFGVSGRTLLKKGDYPIWEEKDYQAAKKFAPNIVVIKLGTNDTKPQNWQYKADFIKDYQTMIKEFEALPSVDKVWIVKPVPVFGDNFSISKNAMRDDVLPKIDSIATLTNTSVIDLYKALSGKENMFPDGVHPNAEGAGVMAGIIAATISN